MADSRLRAVVCDDEATVRRVVTSLLEECGYEVVGQAAGALAAVALVETLKPHVLVLDLSLKGMSGLDVIPSLQAASPETAIVVFTAFDAMGATAARAGVSAVVGKDQPTKLEQELCRVLSQQRVVVLPEQR